MRRQLSIPGACSILIALCLLAGCGGEDAETKRPERPAVEVTVAPVTYGAIDRVADVVGTLYGDDEVLISAKVSGRIQSVDADVGDRLEAGGLLAQIDPVDYQLEVTRRENALREALAKLGLQELPGKDDAFDISKVATVERARFQAANAEARLERSRKLFEQKPPLLSEQDFADLQTGSEVAQRDYEVARLDAQSQLATAQSRRNELLAARQQLSDTQIVAPPIAKPRTFAVAERSVSAGEYVREGAALFRLVVDDRIKFRGALPERYVGDVRVGQPVRLQVAGLGQPERGAVVRISPAIDPATRTFQIEAIFDNPSRMLRPGAFARGVIVIGQQDNVPMVPPEAVLSFAGINKIFSIVDGKAVEHVITPGPTVDGRVALSGVKNVDQVITSNLAKLANGVKVAVTGPATQPAATTEPSTKPN